MSGIHTMKYHTRLRTLLEKVTKTQDNITYERAKRSAHSQLAAKIRQDNIAEINKTLKIAKRIHKRSTTLERSVKNHRIAQTRPTAPTSPLFQMWIKTNRCLVRMKDP